MTILEFAFGVFCHFMSIRYALEGVDDVGSSRFGLISKLVFVLRRGRMSSTFHCVVCLKASFPQRREIISIDKL